MVFNFLVLALIGAGFFYILNLPKTETVVIATPTTVPATSTPAQTALAGAAAAPLSEESEKEPLPDPATETAAPADELPMPEMEPNRVLRIQNPYATSPIAMELINTSARAALVNIFCAPESGTLSPISGSGVIIDPRGVILTNAHVAQYVLLSQDSRVGLSCSVRTGAPATARYAPYVLYIPAAWVQAHASEVLQNHVIGTGEHDYALLLITQSLNGEPLPASFPYVSPDVREGIAFQDDGVLVASYPAEFVGGITAAFQLFPVSSVTTIQRLHTFGTNSIDVLSLGGIIGAQSGSSGGAAVNAWGRLIGLIVTTSEGPTTAERDLHALSLSYINRDLTALSGESLATMLAGDVYAQAQLFGATLAPGLANHLVEALRMR